jgi:predicted transcriptional regulator
MKLEAISALLEGRVLAGAGLGGMEIDRAYAVDLLSDLLALTDERTTLITGNISPQVIRVAEILNVIAIIFVRGKRPLDGTVSYAEKLGIPVVSTDKTMFETCGLMYGNGVRPCKNRPMGAPAS